LNVFSRCSNSAVWWTFSSRLQGVFNIQPCDSILCGSKLVLIELQGARLLLVFVFEGVEVVLELFEDSFVC
jgi:hypothetical protein